jgi:hypothetical protein
MTRCGSQASLISIAAFIAEHRCLTALSSSPTLPNHRSTIVASSLPTLLLHRRCIETSSSPTSFTHRSHIVAPLPLSLPNIVARAGAGPSVP